MNVFDYLDSNEKNLSDDKKKLFIKETAEHFLGGVRHFPDGLETMMNHEIKRRQLLFFLYGAIDCALADFGREKIFGDNDTEAMAKENNLIWDYFQENLGYRIEEVLDILIVCSDSRSPNDNEILGYDRNQILNLVTYGGQSFLDSIKQVREWVKISENKEEEDYYKNSGSHGQLLALLHEDY